MAKIAKDAIVIYNSLVNYYQLQNVEILSEQAVSIHILPAASLFNQLNEQQKLNQDAIIAKRLYLAYLS